MARQADQGYRDIFLSRLGYIMSRRRSHSLDGPVRPGEDQLTPYFDEGTWKRGEDYQRRGRVFDMEMDDDEFGTGLTGVVQGSGGAMYQVTVGMAGMDGDVALAADCTCPVGQNCKHAVALLLQALRRGWFDSAGAPPPASPVRAGAVGKGKKAQGAPAGPQDPLAGALAQWLDTLGQAAGEEQAVVAGARRPAPAKAEEAILYLLDVETSSWRGETAKLDLMVSRRLKSGDWGAGRSYTFDSLANHPGPAAGETDQAVARMLSMGRGYGSYDGRDFLNRSPDVVEWVMERLLASGRAFWRDRKNPPLFRGPDLPGEIDWRLLANGDQAPALKASTPGVVVLPGAAPWALDPATGACGKLLLGVPPEVLAVVLKAPPASPQAAPALAKALAERLPGLKIPPPRTDVTVETDDTPPTPTLRLNSVKLPVSFNWTTGKRAAVEEWADGAWLSFDYGGQEIIAGTPPADMRHVADGKVFVRKRRVDVEGAAQRRLLDAGLALPSQYAESRIKTALSGGGLTFPVAADPSRRGIYADDTPRWPDFVSAVLPRLAAEGWRVEIGDGFRHQIVAADGEWDAEVEDKGGWWFSLDLGIEVDGKRIALLPVLISALAKLQPGAPLESLASSGTIYGRMADGRLLALPFDRVRGLVEMLAEVFGDRIGGSGDKLDLSLAQAVGLEAIAEAVKLRWVGGERLRTLAGRLRAGLNDSVPVPAGFTAELRPYQRQGYGWLQFLAEQGLGGVLADDMGLGKTVQTLAHILAEKEAGRLDEPFLVVSPTSLIPTWRDEAARFAPDLRVLVMHGLDRPRDAGAFKDVDLVLTTYPLLTRDEALLTATEWHGVALDEAQAIKNPATKWTQVACRLKAGHRLCLTGTPVENHLGEAWSQFTFLMPGLLGDNKTFTKVFRTPIEKKGDGERRSLLARRLKPFLLRRTKAEVAAELPPKTEMVRLVELSGAQRDLYETLRLAMDSKVRQAVAAKGLARSAIVILEALLKLRQVCCDPRLVKLRGAAKADMTSAKLDHLMELVPEMVEEGRRILLFSQFTSMLDLIKPELIKAGIPFVELTGDTADRSTPVKRFQAGEVPVFLISLKAGGVGLTLTAADTVIHYDPWWNPAVEDQATDRAHRIGQDKPVFVYKLIAAGTVEERMVELQARKRAVAAALFNTDGGEALAFSEDDLAALFQPLG
jgi:hypothetical protein